VHLFSSRGLNFTTAYALSLDCVIQESNEFGNRVHMFHLLTTASGVLHSVVVNMRIVSPTAQITATAFFALAAAAAACVLQVPRNGTGTTTAVATLGSWSRSLLRALVTADRKIPTREPLLAQSAARNAMTVRFVSVQQSHPA
jgi:hypothetical protein